MYKGNAQQRKNAETLRKMTQKTTETTRAFKHFTNHEWIFDIANTEAIMKEVNEFNSLLTIARLTIQKRRSTILIWPP